MRPGRRQEFSRRPGAGRPGAVTPAAPARTTAGAAVRAGSPDSLRSVLRGETATRRRRPRPSTARLAAVAVVLGLLVISYASSVRTYLAQRSEIAGVRADIAAHRQSIATSEGRIEQWSDPAYVELQARERLGLVMRGDHLYLVEDSGPAAGRQHVTVPTVGGAKVTVPGATTWWSRVAGSVGAAGSATPAPVSPAPATSAQPGTAQPGTAQPGTAQPGTAQPGTTQPGNAQPGTAQPGTAVVPSPVARPPGR